MKSSGKLLMNKYLSIFHVNLKYEGEYELIYEICPRFTDLGMDICLISSGEGRGGG